tara:strand:+ start:343 stop:633 length:291 start_codon:yes stop_codon:yes gene_type:complete
MTATLLEVELHRLLVSNPHPLYSQDGIPEEKKAVIATVKSPTMGWQWTIYEADGTEFFGRVDGFESELGYFTLDDLLTPEAECFVAGYGRVAYHDL